MNDPKPEAAEVRPGPLRRLYDWTLHWAYTPYGEPALGILAFAESSFFPVPPDVLLLPLALGRPARWLRYALLCTAASVLGGIFGYWIGHALWNDVAWIQELFFAIPGVDREGFARVQEWFSAWDFWIVFTAGFTPIPFKLFTVSAGVFGISPFFFVLAALVGRGGRFVLVAWLARRYGVPARAFIERRLGLVTLLFAVLLIGGFAVVKWTL